MPLMMVVQAFNPSPRENYKMGGNSSLSCSLLLRFQEVELPFQTEVKLRANGLLFYFSDLQVEPQFLTLSFY